MGFGLDHWTHEPGTQHRPTRSMFDAWLRQPGGVPADVALKTRLRGSWATWRIGRCIKDRGRSAGGIRSFAACAAKPEDAVLESIQHHAGREKRAEALDEMAGGSGRKPGSECSASSNPLSLGCCRKPNGKLGELEDWVGAAWYTVDLQVNLLSVSPRGPALDLHLAAQFAPHKDNFSAHLEVIPNRIPRE